METVKKSLVARGWSEGGEMNRQSTEYFWGSETVLYDIIIVDTGHCTYICQTHGKYNIQSVYPSVNY